MTVDERGRVALFYIRHGFGTEDCALFPGLPPARSRQGTTLAHASRVLFGWWRFPSRDFQDLPGNSFRETLYVWSLGFLWSFPSFRFLPEPPATARDAPPTSPAIEFALLPASALLILSSR